MAEHRSTKSEVLRFDSSWRLRIFFSLSHACGKTKNIFSHIIIESSFRKFLKISLFGKITQNLKFAERNEV